MPSIITQPEALSATLKPLRAAGKRIGLVPTMGALHEGHASLARQARATSDVVVASIFVNPLQFGANEDLGRYPRTFDADLALLDACGADLVFAPAPQDMYPQGFATQVRVAGLSEGLCGAVRPGHFAGVATVVARLVLLAHATDAWFGEKDFQQLKVIERMVADLAIDVVIHPAPIVREADGLALSSRNRYLDEGSRAIAPALYRELNGAADAIRSGVAPAQALQMAASRLMAAGFDSVDYLELRAEGDLAPLTAYAPPCRLLVAARIGTTRLIDNIRL